MLVRVELVRGEKCTLLIPDTGTAGQLKLEILKHLGIKLEEVTTLFVCFKGQVLSDNQRLLSDYGVGDNSRVVVGLRLESQGDEGPQRSRSALRLPVIRGTSDVFLAPPDRSITEDPDALDLERMRQIDRRLDQCEMDSAMYRRILSRLHEIEALEEKRAERRARQERTVIPDGSAKSPSCESLPDCSRFFFGSPGVVKYVRDHKADASQK